MGMAGPLAGHKMTPQPDLHDLAPPADLDDEARECWLRHADWLAENGLLTRQTSTSFALLCDLYSRVKREQDPKLFVALHKTYLPLAKFFRMVPVDKPGRPEGRHQEKKEFHFG